MCGLLGFLMLLSPLAEHGALGSLPDPQHVWVCQPNALCHLHRLGAKQAPRLPTLPATSLPSPGGKGATEVSVWVFATLWFLRGKNSSIQHNPLPKGWRANTRLSCTKHPSLLDCCLAMTQNLHIKNIDLSNFFLYDLPSVKLNNDSENSKPQTQKLFVPKSVATNYIEGFVVKLSLCLPISQDRKKWGLGIFLYKRYTEVFLGVRQCISPVIPTVNSDRMNIQQEIPWHVQIANKCKFTIMCN